MTIVTRISFRAACLTALVLWAMGPAASAAQDPGSGPREGLSLEEAIVGAVADSLGVAPGRVRVEITGASGLEAQLDSVSASRGGGDRWVVTAWAGGSATTRLARVGLAFESPVAARDLARGHVVSEGDVRQETVIRWGASASEWPDPVGMVTERAVRAGEPLGEPAVRPPLLVRGGDPVEALLEAAGIQLRMRGEALASARRGDRLRVRLESGRRVEATAVDAGVVRLVGGGR